MNYMRRLKYIIKHTLEDSIYYYILFLLLFIAGIVIGALFINVIQNDLSLKFINIASPYLNLESAGLGFFKKILLYNYFFLGVTFLIGIINIGFVSILLVLFRGSLLGLTIGYIIQNLGVKGFIISILGIYPQYIIYLPCLIFAGVLSILFDRRTNLINNRKHKIVNINLADYIILFLIIFSMMTIGVLYESFISPIFFKF